MRIDFDDSLRTGIDAVDEQHEMLVALYNELDEAVWQGRAHRQMEVILARLFKYTKTHFATEEAMLLATGYPELAQHQLEHQRLAERLRKYVVRFKHSEERISVEMLEFVRRWITSHIMESDQAYVAFVKKHADRLAPGAEPAGVDR